jgi:hypothetical protein
LTNFYNRKVTIYNDVPATEIEPRKFYRFVIDKCQIQSGVVEKSDGTIVRLADANTVTTRDVEHYKSPTDYYKTADDLKENFYTVQVNDFVVFDEVMDLVSNAEEFRNLISKYKKNGMSITTVNPSVYGMAVDNVQFSNV